MTAIVDLAGKRGLVASIANDRSIAAAQQPGYQR